MIEKLRVGVLTKTHGLRGEIKLYPTTDDADKFGYIKKYYVDISGRYEELELEYAKPLKNMYICKFKNIDRIESVEKYTGKDIYINRQDAKALKEGENYIADLIGLKVLSDELGFIGYVADVFETGANHVMEVNLEPAINGKDKLLLPYIKQCILDVDVDDKKEILIHILPGLLDI